jgi:hypothetical protein
VTIRRAATVTATLCSLGLVLPAAGCGGGSPVGGVATGPVDCRTMTGVASFSPPLTLSGSASETTTISLSLGSCATSGSSSAVVTNGRATLTNSTASSNCTSLLVSRPVKVAIRWTPSSVDPTTVNFSGYAPSMASSGQGSGFVFPNPGGKASAAGSFAGSNRGAGSVAYAYTTAGESQLLSACQSPAGLSSVAISSGSFTIG